jgi:hypothetical protein
MARHLTERDRAIALALYEHQLLTTGQLTPLFFSSKRRAQDRLRFLYDERVLDRFYPARPYGLGKPQAHWLLDEAGATLVAASLGLERKQLGWQRRDDWGSHPQLLHRLEANHFVTGLIAATLRHGSLGVSEWWGSRSAAARLTDPSLHSRPIPDCGFFLETAAGPIECYLEWDRGTETLARLTHKLTLYRHAEVHSGERRPVNVLFVVPSERRLRALVEAVAADNETPAQSTRQLVHAQLAALGCAHSRSQRARPARAGLAIAGRADPPSAAVRTDRANRAGTDRTRALPRTPLAQGAARLLAETLAAWHPREPLRLDGDGTGRAERARDRRAEPGRADA